MAIEQTNDSWDGEPVDNSITDIVDEVVLKTLGRWNNVDLEYEPMSVSMVGDRLGFDFSIFSIGVSCDIKVLINHLRNGFVDAFEDDFYNLVTNSEYNGKVDDPHADESYWGYYFTLYLS